MQYDTIVYNSDFSRAYKKGKNFVHPQIVLYVNKNRVGHTRIGITTSKKIGNAVKRNRARRVIKNALYQVLPKDVGAFDLVFVARGQTVYTKSTYLEKTIKKLLQKAEILKNE